MPHTTGVGKNEVPSTKRQLNDLQKALYEKAYQEAHTLAHDGHGSIITYSDRFEASLPESFTAITQDSFVDAVDATFCLLGDFHTLKQSQRVLVRLCRQMLKRDPHRRLVIALESFKAIDQDALDAFMSGQLDEASFLAKIRYYEYWGFPWKHFRMILDFARELSIPVLGINSENAGMDPLRYRDQVAARRLTSALEEYPDHQVLFLIGEYHLADDHLPSALRREVLRRQVDASIVRVLSNVDRYFFKISPNSHPTDTQYLKLRDNLFCVMNAPPWVKWQSYAIFEETRSLSRDDDLGEMDEHAESEFDLYTEQTFDFDHQVQNLLHDLGDLLNVELSRSELCGFNVFTGTEVEFLADFVTGSSGHEGSLGDRVLERAVHDGVYYFHPKQTILLTDYSVNNIAEAAGVYLHHIKSNLTPDLDASLHGFLGRVLQAAFGMYASLIFNPRRKCMEFSHCFSFLEANQRRRLVGQARRKRECARQLLNHHEWMLKNASADRLPRQTPSLYRIDVEESFELSRRIGHLLGLRAYRVTTNSQGGHKLMTDQLRTTFKDTMQLWRTYVSLYRAFILND